MKAIKVFIADLATMDASLETSCNFDGSQASYRIAFFRKPVPTLLAMLQVSSCRIAFFRKLVPTFLAMLGLLRCGTEQVRA